MLNKLISFLSPVDPILEILKKNIRTNKENVEKISTKIIELKNCEIIVLENWENCVKELENLHNNCKIFLIEDKEHYYYCIIMEMDRKIQTLIEMCSKIIKESNKIFKFPYLNTRNTQIILARIRAENDLVDRIYDSRGSNNSYGACKGGGNPQNTTFF